MTDSRFMPHTLQNGTYDYVSDGTVVRNNVSKIIYVSSESDLEAIEDEKPGTIAATYGFTAMWQLKLDGTWAEVYAPAN